MNPITIQKQVRDNNEEVTNFMRDLKHWESDMKRKENQLNKLKPDDVLPPVRNKVRKTPKSALKKETLQTSPSIPKKIAGFDYASWDSFDVDKACAEMDEEEDEETETESEEDNDERLREEAIYEKEKGNRLVMNGKWKEAIPCYTRAIECYPHDAIYYANRALCYLKTNKFQLAETDCTSSVMLDDMYVKAYQRRAAARQGLGKLIEAKDDLAKVLELEPMNTRSKTDLIKIEKLINYTVSTIDRSQINGNLKVVNEDNFGLASEERKLVYPIKKPPHLRSKKPLQRINIQEIVNGVSKEVNPSYKSPCDNNGSKTYATTIQKANLETNTRNESVLLLDDEQVPLRPNSSVEFLVGWKRVNSNSNLAYKYLKQIPGHDLPNIFQESLEPTTFSDIISTLTEVFLCREEPVLSYIVGISNVKRLSALTMFMTAADRVNLNKLLTYCIVTGECTEQEGQHLREKYELL